MGSKLRTIWQAATRRERILMAASVAYLLWPMDLLPEALLGLIGLTDDAAALGLLLALVRRIRQRSQ